MGDLATNATSVEKKAHISIMPGTISKVFIFRVISATIVTIARKHSRAKMLCVLTFL
jgi:hypothetical protein